MIKVKEVNKEKEIKETRCDWCNALLEYSEDDIHEIYGGRGFTCPICGDDVFIEPSENIVYPYSFYDFSNGVDINEKEIQRYVDTVHKYLKNSDLDIDYSYTGTGNTMVFGCKNKEELTIFVAKKYLQYDEGINEE